MAKEPAENIKNLKMPDIDTVPLADLIEIINHGGFESEAGPLPGERERLVDEGPSL